MSDIAQNRAQGRAMLEPLVNGFHSQIDVQKSTAVNELDTRDTYINPFWRALGWPVGAQPGLTPDRRDVRVETTMDGIRPDYQFQPNGHTRFFCEAKKPIENLQVNRSHIFQAKSYAWSWAQKDALTIAIL